jgi:hypothetical protein
MVCRYRIAVAGVLDAPVVPSVAVTVGGQFRHAVQLILEDYFLHDPSLSSRAASGHQKRRAPKRKKISAHKGGKKNSEEKRRSSTRERHPSISKIGQKSPCTNGNTSARGGKSRIADETEPAGRGGTP